MIELPDWIHVIERGWLSANNTLVFDGDAATLIDAGYVSHAGQTLALVEHALAGRRLERLLNTHCHSDHMGGNASIARRHGCPIALPSGEASLIDRWDSKELLLDYADQSAERFRYDATFDDGDTLTLGGCEWQVIGTPGHDPNAVAFFEPESRILVSGDALWQNGFGVVFGAIMGRAGAFDEAHEALARIDALGARVVIPGHGAVFDDVGPALDRAVSRLEYYERDLERLARHCVKALFMYSLLDRQRMPIAGLTGYLDRVPVHIDLRRDFALAPDAAGLAEWLLGDLERAGAIARDGEDIVPRVRA